MLQCVCAFRFALPQVDNFAATWLLIYKVGAIFSKHEQTKLNLVLSVIGMSWKNCAVLPHLGDGG